MAVVGEEDAGAMVSSERISTKDRRVRWRWRIEEHMLWKRSERPRRRFMASVQSGTV